MSLSLLLRSARSGWGRLMQSSTAPLNRAGEKWRESHGMGRSGNEDGPLHDLSDFHFADGTPAPETRKQKVWKLKRLTVVDRLEQLEEEMKQLHEEWADFDKNREEIDNARAAEEAKFKKPVTVIKPKTKRLGKKPTIK